MSRWRASTDHGSGSGATVVLLLSALAPGCYGGGLCSAPCGAEDRSVDDNAVRVEGRACTLDPTTVVYPYKVLFVIDISGSNRESDPNDDRARAVREVIESYSDNPSVFFGVITFNSESEPQTPGFTRDRNLLVPGVVDSLRVKEDGTNYLDTLNLAYQLIEQDILSMSEGERARTRYDIQWLSDGIPDPCQRPEPVQALAVRLRDLVERYGLFDLVVNTTQLTYPNARYDVEGCNTFLPGPNYLSPMAEAGRGRFRQMDGGSLEFTIGFTEIRRAWEQRSFYVLDTNRVISGGTLYPDSDGDGLADADLDYEPDPALPDHDRDGCTDRVDEEMLPNLELCRETCRADALPDGPAGLEDTDGDSLPDCAERVLGYFRTRFDSDLDGFPDPVELRFRTNPLDADVFTADSDGDGVTDADEIRTGTNPIEPEDDLERERFAYRYGPLEPVPSETEGVSCFDFAVDNVRLAETQATPNSRRGDNRVCVHVVQTTLDDPNAQPTVTEACKTARYWTDGAIDFIDPVTGVLRFEPEDFRPLGPVAETE